MAMMARKERCVPAGFVVAIMLAACGTAAFLAAADAAYAFQDRSSAVLHWGELRNRVTSLNPYTQKTCEEYYLNKIIYGKPLFEYDPYTDGIVAGIADKWTTYSDSLNWIITIKNDIYFHDGSPLTTDDIKFSLEFYLRHAAETNIPHNVQLEKIQAVSIISPSYFQIDLKAKIERLPLMLADIPIVSRRYYGGNSYAETRAHFETKNPLGYGAYFVSLFIPHQQIILQRHERYYAGKPAFGSIRVQLYPALDRAAKDFITGRLDVMPVYNLDNMREISRADSNFVLVSEPLPYRKMIFINYNIDDPILNSINVRNALSITYERSMYPRSNFQFNVRSIADGPLPRDSWASGVIRTRTEYLTKIIKT